MDGVVDESNNGTLNITSGDIAGDNLVKSGIPGEVLVWHDILYDGPRKPGWPDENTLEDRALFLEQTTGGGLKKDFILETLRTQYRTLADANQYRQIILWFDACLFDQSMLVHLLACMALGNIKQVELLCVDAFPGIAPYNGIGQLQPFELASVYDQRRWVTDAQFRFAEIVDLSFARQDVERFSELASRVDAPLPWIPAAVTRWLQEQPDEVTGLGRLESLALAAIRSGCETPGEIFKAVASADTPPQYWGDITLWAKINSLSNRNIPLVRIEGPGPRLPQWPGLADLKKFRITRL